MMKKFIFKNKIVFSIVLLFRQYVIRFLNYKKVQLSPDELKILNILKKDGIVVIPNYFSKEQCGDMKLEFDKYVNNHSIYCDEHERRVFGIEELSQPINKIFSQDKFSRNICEAYLGETMNLQCTMSARIDYKKGIKYGSGGSWHRDSFSRQVKSISYLTDMSEENGPFMYVKGTHKIWSILRLLLRLKRKGVKANYSRLSLKDLENSREILKKDVTNFPCKAGTLILADIRGLHTTRRLKSGHAYSIFNYYISKFDDNKRGSIRELSRKCIEGFE